MTVGLLDKLSWRILSGRELAGCAAAILIAPAPLWLYFNAFFSLAGLWKGRHWDWSCFADAELLCFVLLLGWSFAAMTMLLLGIPVLLYLRSHGKRGPLPLALGGALAGGAAYFGFSAALALSLWGDPLAPFALEQMSMDLLGAVVGAHCGLCYCMIALREGWSPGGSPPRP